MKYLFFWCFLSGESVEFVREFDVDTIISESSIVGFSRAISFFAGVVNQRIIDYLAMIRLR